MRPYSSPLTDLHRLLVGFPSEPYDLLWPVGRKREARRTGKGTAGTVEEVKVGRDVSASNGE